ncbi:MAG: putative oxidoreductase, Rieske [2Fe-2S] region [Actinomycetia bacterium]|nr:putative oxidoreductase, Rieske [2Fe-2S] region [Actinomycetes bacterium]
MSQAEWVGNTTAGLERAWYPVALSSEVTGEPLGVRLLGRPWVLVRLDGELAAFVDECPHRLYPLSAGTVCGDTLRCAYHGWEFDGDGACTSIPSVVDGAAITGRARLRAPFDVVERYGTVWLAPEEPAVPFVPLPEWDDAAFECRLDSPKRTTASAFQALDNFCDTSHFVSVHAGTFGGDIAALVHPATVERDGWTVTGTYEAPFRVQDDPRVLSGELPEVQPSTQTKTYWPAAAMLLRMSFPVTESTFTVLIACQPEDDTSTRIYRWFCRDDIVGDEERWSSCLEVEQHIMGEDVRALDRYHHHGVPLDTKREVNVPADKMSLGFRRILADLVNA